MYRKIRIGKVVRIAKPFFQVAWETPESGSEFTFMHPVLRDSNEIYLLTQEVLDRLTMEQLSR